MTEEELLVELALVRLDHPGLELDELAALLLRRRGEDLVLALAAENLVVRGELRGGAFDSAVEHLVRIVLRLRDAPD